MGDTHNILLDNDAVHPNFLTVLAISSVSAPSDSKKDLLWGQVISSPGPIQCILPSKNGQKLPLWPICCIDL